MAEAGITRDSRQVLKDNSVQALAERIMERDSSKRKFWWGWLATVMVAGVLGTLAGLPSVVAKLPVWQTSVVVAGWVGVPIVGVWFLRRMVLTYRTYRDALQLSEAATRLEESYQTVREENRGLKEQLAGYRKVQELLSMWPARKRAIALMARELDENAKEGG